MEQPQNFKVVELQQRVEPQQKVDLQQKVEHPQKIVELQQKWVEQLQRVVDPLQKIVKLLHNILCFHFVTIGWVTGVDWPLDHLVEQGNMNQNVIQLEQFHMTQVGHQQLAYWQVEQRGQSHNLVGTKLGPRTPLRVCNGETSAD